MQFIRRAIAGSPIETVLRRSGLGPLVLRWHECRVVSRGVQEVHAFGDRLRLLARSKAELTRVEMTRGDDPFARPGRSPTVIKIDVEGAEIAVLRGLPETLARLLREYGFVPIWTRPRGTEIHMRWCRSGA